ncbi:MAG: hypothetical protein RID42_00355 [Alphaproteobacteria bacterium]
MCFGGFDAPSGSEQEVMDYEASLLGVPPVGHVPVSQQGYVGPVAITTSGFARGADGSVQYQDTDYGFSLRGAAETVGFVASGGSTAALAMAVGRGADAAHGYMSGRGGPSSGGGSLGGPVEAPETGGLPSPPAPEPATDKRHGPRLPAVPAGPDDFLYTQPWPRRATGTGAREADSEEDIHAHLLGQNDSSLAVHTADHEKRLNHVLRRSSNPTGPMGLRVRPTARQPRLLGE